MFLLPLPLFFAGLGATFRGSAAEMLGELGGFAGLMLAAWLLNEGLRAEEAYAARAVARPPAIPRKLFAAALTGASVALAGALGLGQELVARARLRRGGGGGAARRLRARPDAREGHGRGRRRSPPSGSPAPSTRPRRWCATSPAPRRASATAGSRPGSSGSATRRARSSAPSRPIPRDLARARTFLSVYLLGLRDATVKFADLWGRGRDAAARARYEALLGDLEASFASHRAQLLEDNRSDLDVEIEVLRERLQQDGLIAR